ncbi:MAG: hypothetical protein ACREJC_03615 [Tepidisphaeraceae bacterium]
MCANGTKWMLCGVMLALVGCQNSGQQPKPDEFDMSQAQNSVHQFMHLQAASGARSDSTLYGCHFSGGQLNDLGRCELDLMMPAKSDKPAQTMTIYMDVSDDAVGKARIASVEEYLKSAGMPSDAYAVKFGANPGSSSPVAPALERMRKLETARPSQSGYGDPLSTVPDSTGGGLMSNP